MLLNDAISGFFHTISINITLYGHPFVKVRNEKSVTSYQRYELLALFLSVPLFLPELRVGFERCEWQKSRISLYL